VAGPGVAPQALAAEPRHLAATAARVAGELPFHGLRRHVAGAGVRREVALRTLHVDGPAAGFEADAAVHPLSHERTHDVAEDRVDAAPRDAHFQVRVDEHSLVMADRDAVVAVVFRRGAAPVEPAPAPLAVGIGRAGIANAPVLLKGVAHARGGTALRAGDALEPHRI